jgi:uncharacterized damage-inducible protein DinB
MKTYLIDTFMFNDLSNKRMLKKMEQLPDKSECIKYFSHLINSQKKWLARIEQYPDDPGMDWWKPEYPFEKLESEWVICLNNWLRFMDNKNEEDFFNEVKFIGFDGGEWTTPLKDIALQLNYHSIHHRAQMQMIIRKQGFEPDFIDYIGTVYKRLK